MRIASISLPKLVDDLALLGLRLTVTRLCDGSIRLNRWRTIDYWSNSAAVEALWVEHIGDRHERIESVKNHLLTAQCDSAQLLRPNGHSQVGELECHSRRPTFRSRHADRRHWADVFHVSKADATIVIEAQWFATVPLADCVLPVRLRS
jgi:hypothetical protein